MRRISGKTGTPGHGLDGRRPVEAKPFIGLVPIVPQAALPWPLAVRLSAVLAAAVDPVLETI